jgi:hypothetical protein
MRTCVVRCHETQDASNSLGSNPALYLAIILSLVIACVCGLGVVLAFIIFGVRWVELLEGEWGLGSPSGHAAMCYPNFNPNPKP